MAKALQCPSCGAKTRIEALPDSGAVRCNSCGQSMKVPPGLARNGRSRGGGEGAEPPARSSNGPDPGPAQRPAPPRRARGRAPAGAAPGGAAGAVAGGGTAVLSQGPAPAPVRATAAPGAPPMRPTGPVGAPVRDGGESRDALPLALRVGAWVIAVPLGLLIVGIPARQLGYLSSQKLLDVIVKRDLGRFLPIVVVIALWALVSAVLVTLLVEGGRRLMLRRRRNKARQ